MKHWYKLPRLLSLSLLLACGRTPAENCRTIPAPCPEIRVPPSLPLRIFRNFLVVAEGQIGGRKQPYNLVLDTGTAPSVIDSKLAKELGLVTRSSSMTVVGKVISAQTAILSEVDLGPIRAVSLRVQIEDLSRLERDLGMPVAAIMGLDVLSKSDFRIDYLTQRLEFGDIAEAGIAVPFDARNGIAVARVRLAGETARLLIDTGTDRVAMLGGNFRATPGIVLRSTRNTGASTVDQAMGVEVFSAPDFILGEEHFNVEKAYFIPGATDPAFDGLLGVRALGFRAIAYNRARGTVYLQK